MARKEARPTEYKSFPFKVTNLDIEGRTLEGYASVFGNLDSVGDIVHRGAFRKTLEQRGDKIKFLWQHDPKEPLGRPLDLSEDDKGLFVKAIVSKTRRGLDTLELLRDGAIGELSIGYDPIEGATDYSKGKDGEQVRNLKELKLYEFSLVTFAANEEAQVTALKEDPSPSEEKPAPEVTENTIRIRVRDSDDFQDGSLRTIPIGGGDSGIQATVGKLKGETTMTVQSYIFSKDKFSVEQAQAWVDEHKKSMGTLFSKGELEEAYHRAYGDRSPEDVMAELLIEQAEALAGFEEMTDGEKQTALIEAIKQASEDGEGPYRCECMNPDCGYMMESEEHCRDVKCPECGGEMRRAERPGPGKGDEEPEEVKFVGSPRNPYGTHASRGYPGGRAGWKKAWRVYLSSVRDQGPIQGTVRRVSMIAAGMKPPCKIAEMSAEDLGARSGPCGKIGGSWKGTPGDYGLSTWKKPSDDNLEREDIQLTCQDLTDLKRICLQEIAKRQACKEEGGKGDYASLPEAKEVDEAWMWEMGVAFGLENVRPPWEKAADPVLEAKGTPEEVVLASVILQNVMAKLDGDSWERQAAELAVGKLKALYGEGKDEDEVAEMERKAGRVLAARNAHRIAAALTSLIEVLEDAGVDIPGYGKEPEAPKSPKGGGKDLRLELDVLGAELDLLELE